MSIKLRDKPVHRMRLNVTQDNQAMTGTLTFSQTTSFDARLVPIVQQPQVMTGRLAFTFFSAAATVQIFDTSNNPIGFGPAADPQGAFFGSGVVAFADEIWWVTSHPVGGGTIVPAAGGRFTWTGCALGSNQFSGFRRRTSTGVETPFTKTFNAAAAAGDTAQFAPYQANAIPDFNLTAGVPFTLNGFHYLRGATQQGSLTPVQPTYTLTPAPLGLSINVGTGLVTGTPTTSATGVVLRCTTANGFVEDTFNVTVTVAPTVNGSLVLAVAAANPAQSSPAGNLTLLTDPNLGDWLYFGHNADQSVNVKNNVLRRIEWQSREDPQGGSVFDPVAPFEWPRISWTDGVPTGTTPLPEGAQNPVRQSLANYRGGAFWWNLNSQNNGFKLVVQAGTRPRTLVFFSGSFDEPVPPVQPKQVTYEFSLSDGSAPSILRATPSPFSTDCNRFEVTFNAASENQTLTVTGIEPGGSGGIVLGAVYLIEPGGLTNMPPRLHPIGDKRATVGVPLVFNIKAWDFEDGASLALSVTGLPAGATFNDTGIHTDQIGDVRRTGQLTWTPTVAGTHQLVFKATAPNASFVTQTVTITVHDDPVALPSFPLQKSGRWYTYDNVPVYMIGGDMSSFAADTRFDYERHMDVYKKWGINHFRVWCEPYWDPAGLLHPWVYDVGTGKYDLDTFNQNYFDHYRDVIRAARDRGLFILLSVFDAYPAEGSWWNNTDFKPAWNKVNNSNGAFTGVFSASWGQDIFTPAWYNMTHAETSNTGKTLLDYQHAFIDKLVQEVGEFPNIEFEIMNEPYAWATDPQEPMVGAWLAHMAQYIAASFAAQFPGQPRRLISAAIEDNWKIETNLVSYVNIPEVDIFDSHLQHKTNLPLHISQETNEVQLLNKILFQAEGNLGENFYFNLSGIVTAGVPSSINSLGVDYSTREMWGWFLSGGHYHWYELQWIDNPGGWEEIVAPRIKAFRNIVDTLNWSTLVPVNDDGTERDTLCTAGPGGANRLVTAELGQQYVVYFWGTPSNTNAVVTLVGPASYTATWYDTRNGAILKTVAVTVSVTGPATLVPPLATTWSGNAGLVLTIKRT